MFSYRPSIQNPHSTGKGMNYQYSHKYAHSRGQQNCKHLYLLKNKIDIFKIYLQMCRL